MHHPIGLICGTEVGLHHHHHHHHHTLYSNNGVTTMLHYNTFSIKGKKLSTQSQE